ncbi:hypothetical protein EVA_06119 [gut metagenome]|uniref:Uncharacterized protein n=1 Tax=gut metagenome TaxID=749906 RepID=J9GFR0_9ZZZZ
MCCFSNKLFQPFTLVLLIFNTLLKLCSVHSELFLFLLIICTHHGETLVRQLSFGIVLVNLHEQPVQLCNSLFSLCQLLFPCLNLFLTLHAHTFLYNCTKVRFIAENIANDRFHMHPYHIFQNDCSDIVGSAFFIVLTMCGTLEKILSLFKIAGCTVIQFLTAIGTIDQTREQACLASLAPAVAILSQHLNFFEYILLNNCVMSTVEDGLIFHRILTLFLIPDRIRKSLEVDNTAGIFSSLQNVSYCCLMPLGWILRRCLWGI